MSSSTISPNPTAFSTTKTNVLLTGLEMACNWIYFIWNNICECIFDNDLYENENELKCKYKFKNVNDGFNFYDYGDLCNGLLYPSPTITPIDDPTPAPSPLVIIDFIYSRAPLREQFDFIYLVDNNNNGNNIMGDNMSEKNNKNFYDNGYYPTRNLASRTGLRENDILEYVFNIVCSGIGFYCDVNNEMINNCV